MLACNKFEYSPFQSETMGDMPNNLNIINLDKLLSNEINADDTVTIIYTGDSQRFYDELEDLVKKVNTISNVDFLILCGDIADFGILQEYLWIHEQLNKLNVPYLCAIGNHDLVANNGEVYTKIFGEKNFSFTYKKYKFLFHDTNGREYNFNGNVPDLWWLSDQLEDTIPEWFVGVSHVPPYDIDFDKALEYPYKNLFSSTSGFIISLHGHLHGTSDSYYYGDSVRYMTSNSVDKKEVVLLKFINGKIIKQMIEY
jgi:3',5'-cyclic AMP phosphodiesterase CpdA